MNRRNRLFSFSAIVYLFIRCTQVASFVSQTFLGVSQLTRYAVSHQELSLSARDPKKLAKRNKGTSSSGISEKRKKQLGIVDEREYDLGVALATNTDPFITKLVAGSFIAVVIALLFAGIVVPSLSDYGEGVCNPIRTAGRC